MAAPGFVRGLLSSSGHSVKLLTLTIVERDGRLLLGLKKRGFGTGYYNGFGGKVEVGETIQQAAYRELLEEAGIAAVSLQQRGILTFVFDDQPIPWQVHVFSCEDYAGEPTETDEMAPVWMMPNEIPYNKMWADDVFWYPLFLQNKLFEGLFAFENTHSLVWHHLQQVEQLGMPATLLLDGSGSSSN